MRVHEFLHAVETRTGRVRMWARRSDPFSRAEAHLQRQDILTTVAAHEGKDGDVLAQALSDLPFCSAVEVSERDSPLSVLVYPDWP